MKTILIVLFVVILARTLDSSNDSSAVSSNCTISSTLQQGSNSREVQCLEQRLSTAGFSPGTIDNSFDGDTRNAVLSYQRANNLTVDGIVASETGSSLGIWSGGSNPPSTDPPGTTPATEPPVASVIVTTPVPPVTEQPVTGITLEPFSTEP